MRSVEFPGTQIPVGTGGKSVLVFDGHIQSVVAIFQLDIADIIFKLVCDVYLLVAPVDADGPVFLILHIRSSKILHDFVLCYGNLGPVGKEGDTAAGLVVDIAIVIGVFHAVIAVAIKCHRC